MASRGCEAVLTGGSHQVVNPATEQVETTQHVFFSDD